MINYGIFSKSSLASNKLFALLPVFLLLFHSGTAQILVKQDQAPNQLVNKVLLDEKSGLKIDSVSFTGSNISIGSFVCNSDYLPVKNGVVLSTGNAADVDGPNESGRTGTGISVVGDTRLQKLAKSKTSDATVLSFVLWPNSNLLEFDYFFASEEYPEFVNKGVNDVFAFFISGPGYDKPQNIATLPNSNLPVSVDAVNANTNAEYFLENKQWGTHNLELFRQNEAMGERAYNCTFDGMTVCLKAKAEVIPFQPYRLTMAIADVGDNLYDSGVFIKGQSLKSAGEKEPVLPLLENYLAENADTTLPFFVDTLTNTLALLLNVQFNFNDSEVLPEYFENLNKLVQLFTQFFELKVKVIGYTDSIGTNEYNMQLSELRAKSVRNYLIEHGVEPNRIKYEGRGSKEPLFINEKKQVALNRRVEFVLKGVNK